MPESSIILDRNALRPMITGPAECFHCQHKWTGTSEPGTWWIKCPACLRNLGHHVHHVEPTGLRLQCQCGCQAFFVLRDSVVCPNCGLEHTHQTSGVAP